MKLGILGTGMIVKDVLTMYHELGVEKTYLFSTKKSKSQALELMKTYHLDKVYTDYDELLQSDVDTIYCALPNHLHYEFSKKALENDKNVIIEKPITARERLAFGIPKTIDEGESPCGRGQPDEKRFSR